MRADISGALGLVGVSVTNNIYSTAGKKPHKVYDSSITKHFHLDDVGPWLPTLLLCVVQ